MNRAGGKDCRACNEITVTLRRVCQPISGRSSTALLDVLLRVRLWCSLLRAPDLGSTSTSSFVALISLQALSRRRGLGGWNLLELTVGVFLLMILFILSMSIFPLATRGINNDSYYAAAAAYAEQVAETQRHLLNGSQNGSLTNGSTNVTGLNQTGNLAPGMAVIGYGIPAGTTISSITSSTSIRLSNAATYTGTSQLFFRISSIAAGSANTSTVVSGLAYKAQETVTLVYSTSVSTFKYDNDGITPLVLDLSVTVSWNEGTAVAGGLTHKIVTETLIGAATQ